MRRLAKELGVEAMSLYNHVAGKDEILSGIGDLVAAEIELPPNEGEWKAAIRRNALSTQEVLQAHRWASALWMSRRGGGGGGAQMRRSDWILRTLREAGLPPELRYHALHILEAYVLGITVQRENFPYSGEEIADLASRFLERVPEDEYPDMVEHIRQHMDPPPSEKSGFELGLDLILDGLERARDAATERGVSAGAP
jgi:AcrR family transcriptional regulator